MTLLESWRPGEFHTVDEMLAWLGSLPGLHQIAGEPNALASTLIAKQAWYRNDKGPGFPAAERDVTNRFALAIWQTIADDAVFSDTTQPMIEWQQHVSMREVKGVSAKRCLVLSCRLAVVQRPVETDYFEIPDIAVRTM